MRISLSGVQEIKVSAIEALLYLVSVCLGKRTEEYLLEHSEQ